MKRLLGVRELMEYLSIGRNNAMKIGKESGSIVRYGRRVLYDRERIDSYIERMVNA